MDIHIPRTPKCCYVLDLLRIYQILRSQEQALLTPFMSCKCPPERHNPKAWTHYACKGTTIFRIMQTFFIFVDNSCVFHKKVLPLRQYL